jgi:hypothetical protein
MANAAIGKSIVEKSLMFPERKAIRISYRHWRVSSVQFDKTLRRRKFFAGVPGVRVNEMVVASLT